MKGVPLMARLLAFVYSLSIVLAVVETQQGEVDVGRNYAIVACAAALGILAAGYNRPQ